MNRQLPAGGQMLSGTQLPAGPYPGANKSIHPQMMTRAPEYSRQMSIPTGQPGMCNIYYYITSILPLYY